MNKKLLVWLLILSTLSLAGQLALYPFLPGNIPTHWNVFGQVDGWGAGYTGLFLAAMPLGGTLLMYLLPEIDPKKENYTRHRRAYSIFSIAIVTFFAILGWGSTLSVLGLPLPLNRVYLFLIGLLFIILGNYMPQLRPNYFVGIKTPWTIHDPGVWRKTHRLGGLLFCLAGLCFVVTSFFSGSLPLWLVVVLVILVIILPFAYSAFVYYRQKKNGNS